MKKTHKKILGFAGLGLVAAVTTVAAVMPSPSATAVSTQTDTLQIRVVPAESDIQVTPADGGEIHQPTYEFDVLYSGVTDIKAVLVNKDAGGNIIFGPTEIWHIDADWDPGSKHFSLNLNEYGGYGNFTITVTGLGHGGVPVEKTTVVKYTKEGGKEVDGGELKPDPDTGDTNPEVDIPKERVGSVIFNVYDDGGNLVLGPITIPNPSSAENIDFSSLPDGEYTGEIISKDWDGDIIGTKYMRIVVDKDGSDENVNIEVEAHTDTIKKAVVTVRDKDGNIIVQKDFNDPVAGTNMTITIDGGVPAGSGYIITTDYYNESDKLVDSVSTPLIKIGADGHGDVNIDTEIDTIKTIIGDVYDENGNLVRQVVADRETGEVKVYDRDGNLIMTIPGGYSDAGGITIPFAGLDWGTYKVKIHFLNQHNKPIGNIYVYTVYWYGSVPVPDTGGLFQGLNISREDYLITGAVVFMIIGVVAFGVVAKNRKSKKSSRKTRR